jgi:hypothetical protein
MTNEGPRSPELEPRYGMVIVLDALGTQALWGAEGKERLLAHRINLRDFIRDKVTDFQIPTECGPQSSGAPYEMVTVETKVQFISDTVVISFVPHGTVVSCLLFSHAFDLATGLMVQGVKDETLFRGAISAGFIHVGKDFLMGRAVDEAAEWSTLADWAGVMLTPMAGYHMDSLVHESPGVPPLGYVRWEVPASRSRGADSSHLGEAWAIAWPWYAKAERRKLEALFLQSPVAPDVYRKFQNTMKFFDYLWSGSAPMDHHFMYEGSYVQKFLLETEGPNELLDAWAKNRAALGPPGRANTRPDLQPPGPKS